MAIHRHLLPKFLAERTGPHKITPTNAQELMRLHHDGYLTASELRFVVQVSGLRPRTINSAVSDLRRSHLTADELVTKAYNAWMKLIPKAQISHIMNAPVGEFFNRIYWGLIRQGYDPPYTFIWKRALERARQKDSHGRPLYPEKGIRLFERTHWRYYELSRRVYRLKRRIQQAKEDSEEDRAMKERLKKTEKEALRLRRRLSRFLKRM